MIANLHKPCQLSIVMIVDSHEGNLMTQVSLTGPGDGEVIILGPTQMRILEDGRTTGHRLGIGEITLAPHTEGPPQHRHARHDEGFYVVSGTARFTVGEQGYEAPAGTLVMIPPGAPHTFANPGDEPAVLLNTFTPDLYVQYFRDLRDMITGGQDLSPQATIAAPALVLWGDSDQIADPGYGRAFADAIPKARFELLTGTGHMPQVETPDQVLDAVG